MEMPDFPIILRLGLAFEPIYVSKAHLGMIATTKWRNWEH